MNEVTTPSGLKYTDLTEGTGAEAKKGNSVEVHYTGWLATKSKAEPFDSSVGRRPFVFPLGGGRETLKIVTPFEQGNKVMAELQELYPDAKLESGGAVGRPVGCGGGGPARGSGWSGLTVAGGLARGKAALRSWPRAVFGG